MICDIFMIVETLDLMIKDPPNKGNGRKKNLSIYSGTSYKGHLSGPAILSFVERLSSFRGDFL